MTTIERPPYIYGEILSRLAYVSEENEPPQLGSFLWQGATIGALLAFLSPVNGLLSNDPYYGSLFVAALPWFLAYGIGFGLLEGAIIWACAYMTGHRLNVVVRASIGVVVLVLLLFAIDFLFAKHSANANTVSVAHISIYISCGVLFGLVIGSKFDPLHEFIRGTTPPRWSFLTAITGFALRLLVILFLMYSILIFIWTLMVNFTRREFTFAVIALSHFIAALVIVFVRMPFWVLLPLALLVNFPIAVFITDVLGPDQSADRVITLGYLHVWAAFLLCRFSVPQPALLFIKKELRYYLFD